MSTFLAIFLAFVFWGMLAEHQKVCKQGCGSTLSNVIFTGWFFAVIILLIWVIFWLMLPSWGIGAIYTCFGKG